MPRYRGADPASGRARSSPTRRSAATSRARAAAGRSTRSATARRREAFGVKRLEAAVPANRGAAWRRCNLELLGILEVRAVHPEQHATGGHRCSAGDQEAHAEAILEARLRG